MVVLLSLGAAALFGASSVLMHTQARAAPADHALRPALLVHLARQPAWLAGIGTQIAGFALLATALEMGSLSLVQAIIPVGLLLALPLAARVAELARSSAQGQRDADRRRQVGSGMRGDKRRTIRTQDDHVTDHVDGRTWRYKAYVHQDVVILNRNLVDDVLRLFRRRTLAVHGRNAKPHRRVDSGERSGAADTVCSGYSGRIGMDC